MGKPLLIHSVILCCPYLTRIYRIYICTKPAETLWVSLKELTLGIKLCSLEAIEELTWIATLWRLKLYTVKICLLCLYYLMWELSPTNEVKLADALTCKLPGILSVESFHEVLISQTVNECFAILFISRLVCTCVNILKCSKGSWTTINGITLTTKHIACLCIIEQYLWIAHTNNIDTCNPLSITRLLCYILEFLAEPERIPLTTIELERTSTLLIIIEKWLCVCLVIVFETCCLLHLEESKGHVTTLVKRFIAWNSLACITCIVECMEELSCKLELTRRVAFATEEIGSSVDSSANSVAKLTCYANAIGNLKDILLICLVETELIYLVPLVFEWRIEFMLTTCDDSSCCLCCNLIVLVTLLLCRTLCRICSVAVVLECGILIAKVLVTSLATFTNRETCTCKCCLGKKTIRIALGYVFCGNTILSSPWKKLDGLLQILYTSILNCITVCLTLIHSLRVRVGISNERNVTPETCKIKIAHGTKSESLTKVTSHFLIISNITAVHALNNEVAIVDDRVETIPCVIQSCPCSTEVIVHVTSFAGGVERLGG